MSDIRMVPYEERGQWSPTQEQAIGSVRCEEFIEAASGLRRFCIVRSMEEQVSESCETREQAWADWRKKDSEVPVLDPVVVLAHAIAYSAACTMIESECAWHGTEGVGWFDVSIENFGDDDVLDCVKYLEARGLIERHAENRDWIQMRDESEATA